MKKREEEIKKYVPKAYQGSALNSSKMELKTLEAELKAAKIEAVGDTKLGSEGFEGVVSAATCHGIPTTALNMFGYTLPPEVTLRHFRN